MVRVTLVQFCSEQAWYVYVRNEKFFARDVAIKLTRGVHTIARHNFHQPGGTFMYTYEIVSYRIVSRIYDSAGKFPSSFLDGATP